MFLMSDVILLYIGAFLAVFGELLSLPLAMACDELFWEGVGGCESHPGTKLYLETFPKDRHATEAAADGVLAIDKEVE